MSKFSSWFSRLRSSSKHFYGNRTAPTVFNGHRTTTSLLPLALAISAGSLALQPHFNPSFCDNDRGVTVGGKGSTQLVVKGSKKEIPPELLQALRIVCQDDISLDYDERYNHGKPQNSFHKAVNIPDVIVYPRSEEEVSKIVKLCNDHKVPIVPYGGATSIEGHTLSPHGGVCIDMSSMKPSHKILPLL